jgi:hypothetical protein
MSTARKMWRTLEPYHGMIYFVPEAGESYAGVGLRGARAGYFASRSAAMGAVPAEVVIATFFNFEPGLVRKAMFGAWDAVTPTALVEARFDAADRALRRLLGEPTVKGAEVREAAELAQAACEACRPEGRPLFAGHAALAWRDEPHLVLWQAITRLREFRGDGHVAALTVEGITGVQALLLHAASGDVPAAVLQASRAWPDLSWLAAADDLRARGWLTDEAGFTDEGRRRRQWVEDRTDELATAPWAALGDEACARLRDLVRPLSRAIVDAGTFPMRTSAFDEE